MAVKPMRHPKRVRPVELQRRSTKTSGLHSSTPPRVAVNGPGTMFCTTLQRVKKVSFDKEALMTDVYRSNNPSTINPPRQVVIPVEEFPSPEFIRVSTARAIMNAQQ